jgi:Xaa-Pro aminopeptidase
VSAGVTAVTTSGTTAGTTRLERARALLDAHGLDGLMVSRTAGKRWLSGFAMSRADDEVWSGTLLVTPDRQLVVADSRYTEQASVECPDWEIAEVRRPKLEMPGLLSSLGLRRWGAEAEILSHDEWDSLRSGAPEVELVPIDDALRQLRLIKDPDEQATIARACALTDRCFENVLATVRRGMTERDVALSIDTWFRANGAEDLAFDTIALVGARASMPHGRPSDTLVADGEVLLLDFGCQVDGYRSDMTRTIFIGEPDDETAAMHNLVAASQQRAADTAAPGVACTALDRAARDVFAEAGWTETFGHGLGHGIGLETHEAPSLKYDESPLLPGMTFTIEPGIYLPGRIGIRIEDDFLLTDEGLQRLTVSPRDIIVL